MRTSYKRSTRSLGNGKDVTIDKEMLIRNFEKLADCELELSGKVYDILFEKNPDWLDLFTAHHSAAGRQMVRETLMYAVDHLNAENWVGPNLTSLGKKHVEYEVDEDMYRVYIETLLLAMADVSGTEWCPELESGWSELFEYLSNLMIEEHQMEAGIANDSRSAAAH